jgi:hypothetical protein
VVPERDTGWIFVGLVLRKLNASLLFDIVDEGKRSAGGVCPRGSAGQLAGQRNKIVLAFQVKYKRVNALAERQKHMISRQF